MGLALAELGDRDQAIEKLTTANQLYKKENGKDFTKILAKIEELKDMPREEGIIFGKPDSSVINISYGVVIKYNSERGFGFIKDDNDKKKFFFHITKVKNRTEIIIGSNVKFIKESGERGLQASKVWVIPKI